MPRPVVRGAAVGAALLKQVESYRDLAIVAILSFVAGFLTATFVRRPVATGSPEELPVIGKPVVTIVNNSVLQLEASVEARWLSDLRVGRPVSLVVTGMERDTVSGLGGLDEDRGVLEVGGFHRAAPV